MGLYNHRKLLYHVLLYEKISTVFLYAMCVISIWLTNLLRIISSAGDTVTSSNYLAHS